MREINWHEQQAENKRRCVQKLRKQLNGETDVNNLRSRMASRDSRVVPRIVNGAATDPLLEEKKPLPVRNFLTESDISVDEKLEIFYELFLGRKDVYAVRAVRFGVDDASPQPCYQPVRRSFSVDVVDAHLRGLAVIGVYPMVEQSFCRFVVVDFDEKTWREDGCSVLRTAKALKVPVYPEISRSGNGLHLWIFFSELVPAILARRLGASLLAAATVRDGAPRLLSFDRMIPAQDYLKESKQIGNLVALPLQMWRRLHKASVFVDDNLEVIPKQWSLLRGIVKISKTQLEEYLSKFASMLGVPSAVSAVSTQRVKGRRRPEHTDDLVLMVEDFFTFEHSRLKAAKEPIQIVVSNSLAISCDELTPVLRAVLIHLASFWNPEYLKRRRELKSCFGIQKKFVLADQRGKFLTLPRGLLRKLEKVLQENRISYVIKDCRDQGQEIVTSLTVDLRSEQRQALEAMLRVENGILVAATGFGKTVLAFALINALRTSTMILVGSKTIAKQWAERARTQLGLGAEDIGMFFSGQKKRTHILDIVSPLKVGRMEPEERKQFMKGYGLLIVDECHHAGAGSYVEALENYAGRCIYGLTATPKRRDGRMPAVRMLIGPQIARFDVDNVDYKIIKKVVCTTPMTCVDNAMYSEQVDSLIRDKKRLALVKSSVEQMVKQQRHILVLTERLEHLTRLAEVLAPLLPAFHMLTSEMKPKDRKALLDELEQHDPKEPLVLLSTGGVAGEGFDCPILDALVISLPIAWEAKHEQYVGRLLRRTPSKRDVVVIDFVDLNYPLFRSMWRKREASYQKMAFHFEEVQEPLLIEQSRCVDQKEQS